MDTETHITHEQAQGLIYKAKYDALTQIVSVVDSILAAGDAQYEALKTKSEAQIAAHYASRTSVLGFRQKLLDQMHELNKARIEEVDKARRAK